MLLDDIFIDSLVPNLTILGLLGSNKQKRNPNSNCVDILVDRVTMSEEDLSSEPTISCADEMVRLSPFILNAAVWTIQIILCWN